MRAGRRRGRQSERMSSTGGRIAGDKSSQGGEADGEMRRTNRKRRSHVCSEGCETGATQEKPMQRSKGERGRKVGSGREETEELT